LLEFSGGARGTGVESSPRNPGPALADVISGKGAAKPFLGGWPKPPSLTGGRLHSVKHHIAAAGAVSTVPKR